jgi:very-short-patch-repair endonuclease
MDKTSSAGVQPIPYTTNKSQHAYMRQRQAQNSARCVENRNENWMAELLQMTGHKWNRQAQWGFRLFDFWNHDLGVAVEVDGPEHARSQDAIEDEYNFRRSAIVVLHVRNQNADDAALACQIITKLPTWAERRALLGNQVHVDATRKLRQEYLATLCGSQPIS